MMSQGLLIAALVSLQLAFHTVSAGSVTAYATFNDYGTQPSMACGGKATNTHGSNIFAAAIGDGGPMWKGPKCAGTQDKSKCSGKGTCVKDCGGPACPKMGNCGECYNVSCSGPMNAQSGQGKCKPDVVKVKIVDACPSSHPMNFCKTAPFGGSIPAEGACTVLGKDAIDLATPVKNMLSTYAGGLMVKVEGPVKC